MKLTKFEHACVVIEEQGKCLVVDPGVYSTSFTDFSNVIAVVVTHSHQDHFDIDKVRQILAANPDATIFTTQAVASQLGGYMENVVIAKPGEERQASPFKLSFTGGKHAYIHDNKPEEDNLGIVVNDLFYYPGDSFELTDKPVKLVGVPASGPWMKAGEAMDFLLAIKAERAFPTHDAFLSAIGEVYMDNWLAQAEGIGYHPLKPGETIEVS